MKQILLLFLLTSVIIADETPSSSTKETVQKILKNEDAKHLIHKYYSASCFNETWSFIDKKILSQEDIENMLLASYASLYHWKKRPDCQPKNLSIAYWQLSRVHYLASDLKQAKSFGEKCLNVSIENNLDPFFIGYAHEALANAFRLSDNKPMVKKQVRLAREHLEKVKDKANHGYLKSDLEKIEKTF